MTHVVTERCVDCRYTDCCAVCPADCFFEVKSPAMLVIDPNTCIDCALCIPECPIYAIYPEAEVPAEYKEWIAKNAELAPTGTQISEKIDALETAIPLEEIHAREKAKGWSVKDPQAVGGAGESESAAAPAAAAPAAPAAPPPPGPAAPAPAAGEKKPRARIAKAPRRPPLGVNPGGRLRIRHRTGTVQEMRKMKGDEYSDVRILLDGDARPTWHGYAALQTLKEKGEVEVLDPGPGRGLLERLFGAFAKELGG